MIRRSLLIVSVVIALSMTAGVAWGDDINPPDYRGQPNTVFAEFVAGDQTQGEPVLVLEGSDFPPGGFPPYAEDLDGTGPIEPGGRPQLIGYQPFTPSGGIYTIYVPNVVDDLSYKEYRIQIAYEWQESAEPAEVRVADGNFSGLEGPFKLDPYDEFILPSEPDAPTLKYEVWEGQLYPNPDWEVFEIETSGDLHQVVIDTISAPEPASMGVLAAGGLVTLLRRRRR